MTNIPISLYIHIPWCIKKCPYCDFNSYALKGGLAETEYVTRLIEDLQLRASLLQQRSLHSVFIGGGTPSLFSAESFQRLLHAIKPYLPNTDIEITLEANPGTTEHHLFEDYHHIGINRLSLGIQSVNDQHLKTLGRIHNTSEAKQAYHMARRAGFDNINLDLMFALPQQSTQGALAELQTIIDWQPNHISWYQLTLEPNTYFHRYPPQLPDDGASWQMQQQGQALLKQAGFQHYEVSAYTQATHHCQHNLNYWQFGDYLGIGAGAHSKITDINTGTITRQMCWRQPRDYLNPKKSIIQKQHNITQEQLGFEFMLNALRLQQPIPINLFKERTQLTLKHIEAPLAQAAQLELLHINNQQFQLSQNGRRYLNDALQLFL